MTMLKIGEERTVWIKRTGEDTFETENLVAPREVILSVLAQRLGLLCRDHYFVSADEHLKGQDAVELLELIGRATGIAARAREPSDPLAEFLTLYSEDMEAEGEAKKEDRR